MFRYAANEARLFVLILRSLTPGHSAVEVEKTEAGRKAFVVYLWHVRETHKVRPEAELKKGTARLYLSHEPINMVS